MAGFSDDLINSDTVLLGSDCKSVRNDDYKFDIAMDRREGSTNWRKFGYNLDVDSATPETIWASDGRWTQLTSAETLDVVSTDANDTSAGTGARTVLINGVGVGHVFQEETVTLNGLTPVVTTNTWLGVNRVSVATVGSGSINAGDITCTASTAATIQSITPADEGTTQQCIYICPATKCFLLDGLWWNVTKLAGGSAPKVTFSMYCHHDVTHRVWRMDVDTSIENSDTILFQNPFRLDPGWAMELVINTDTNNTVTNANFWGTELPIP